MYTYADLIAPPQFHYDECPAYPLTCPNICGVENIKRQDMADHHSKCPQEPVECPFAETGCKVYGIRRYQFDGHLSSNQQQLTPSAGHGGLQINEGPAP